MSRLEGLVDLSLFATSPTDDHRFTTSYVSPTVHIRNDVPCYRAQREFNRYHDRNFASKPLPPLPQRRLCQRRSGPRRHDPNSRCILTRIRRVRTSEHLGGHSASLQQRRAFGTTPELTLSLPPTTMEQRDSQPSMVWMPDEQMWLFRTEIDQSVYPYFEPYPAPSTQYYARSEPSPDRTAHFDFAPIEPFQQAQPYPEDSPDEIRDQFLRLIRSHQDERLSPLFQEAIQSVPPMTDPSPSTPHFPYETERQWTMRDPWLSDSSEYQSFHTANASLTEEPRSSIPTTPRNPPWSEQRTSLYSRISRDNPWSPMSEPSYTENSESAVSRSSHGPPWGPWDQVITTSGVEGTMSVISQITQERPWGEEPRSVISPIFYESSWEGLARRIVRPASAMN